MTEDKQVRVTVAHIRDLAFCARGARVWFARHGLDYSDFVMHGAPVEMFEKTGDALGLQLAAHAREQAGE